MTMTRQSNEGRRVALTHTRRKEGDRENYSDETTALGDGTPLASEGHHGGEEIVFSSQERWKRASHRVPLGRTREGDIASQRVFHIGQCLCG